VGGSHSSVSERCQEALGKAPGEAQKEKPALRVPGGRRHLSGARQELKGQIGDACRRSWGDRGFNQDLAAAAAAAAVALQQPPHLLAAQKPRTSCSCQQHQWQPGKVHSTLQWTHFGNLPLQLQTNNLSYCRLQSDLEKRVYFFIR